MDLNKLNNLLENIEREWLPELYGHIRELFIERPVPSHDHTHHLRVWIITRDVLSHLAGVGFSFTADELLALMIAVFFHDAGMVKTLDEKHGVASARLLQQYLKKTLPVPPELMTIAYQAVEKHDDKAYIESWISPGVAQQKSIYHIVSVADDLDALGYTGIYRYLEIYTLRKIPQNHIAERVLTNLHLRFKYFLYTMSNLPSLIKEQQARYEITSHFFEEWISADQNDSEYPVAEKITQELVNWKHDLNQLITLATEVEDNQARNFFQGYAIEKASFYELLDYYGLQE